MTSEDAEPEATASSGKSSGERSEPRGEDDDIPLDITGHEERKRERESDDASGVFGDEEGAEEEEEGAADDESDEIVDAETLLEESPADPEPDPEDDEVEPVELLVQLAKRGDIEPWDIDIVAVTDTFLEALDEADLRTSGRALFYASVLLRMKSDAMLDDGESDEPEEQEPERAPWEPPPPGEDGERPAYDPVTALESEMDRRLDRKHARGSPETLDELVRELREAER
jgi:segregation and condensation protein A